MSLLLLLLAGPFPLISGLVVASLDFELELLLEDHEGEIVAFGRIAALLPGVFPFMPAPALLPLPPLLLPLPLPLPPPSLPLSNVFSPLTSPLNSFSLLSSTSLCASNALGIKFFSSLTSSTSFLFSCSLLSDDSSSCVTTVSRSVSAVSRRSVRACSAALSAAVSVVSVSRRSKARVKEASMADLSDSKAGGLGGAMCGRIYRCRNSVN